jgi:hypothetical protein
MKRAIPPKITLGRIGFLLVKLHTLAHHLRDFEAITNVIKEGVWKAHESVLHLMFTI